MLNKYPTLKSLFSEFNRKDISEKAKKELLQNIEGGSKVGDDNGKCIGKKLAERICLTLWSIDPDEEVDPHK